MKKLKEVREKHNYTYDDMSKMLGISKTYYWQIENQKRRVYYYLAVKIAKIFRLRPDDIFFDDFN